VKTFDLLDGKLHGHRKVSSYSASYSGLYFALQDMVLLWACKEGNVPTVTGIVKHVKDGSAKLTITVRTNFLIMW
jgi:hypothetical protein